MDDRCIENNKIGASREIPEDFECEGSARERPKRPSRPKGSFKKLNSYRRLHGLGYTKFKSSNLVPPKKLGDRCTDKCKKFGKKCDQFSNDDRKQIFEAYYKLPSLQLQREFICRHVESAPKKGNRAGENSRRKQTNTYTLTIRKQRKKVCQKIFLETLAISEKVVRTAMLKLDDVGMIEPDRRGGRVESLQESDKIKRELVTSHINRFPRIESHFCRQNTDREYLSSDLTLMNMYQMFISDKYNDGKSVSYTFYSSIFHEQKLSFHHPKKYQCSLCNTYRTGNETTKQHISDEYKSHLNEKEKVRDIKGKCKKESLNSKRTVSAVFDLQQVISLPRSFESAVFYKRRLAVFNLTVYDLASRDCVCYLWNETLSHRGSSEISTCVFKYLQGCDDNENEKVNLFADGCPGQNKNSIMASMLVYFIRNSKHVVEVKLRFFETNHGQNEGDSAHSAITTAMDAKPEIFTRSELVRIFREARLKQPYHVREMESTEFLDFKSYSKNLCVLSARKNDNGNGTINWKRIMELRVLKATPNKIYYKNSHSSENYESITLCDIDDDIVYELNSDKIKLPAAKYEDLMSLCTGDVKVIRKDECIKFYKDLPHVPLPKEKKPIKKLKK